MLLRPAYPLETERMLLRPYEPGDLEALLEMHGREDVTAFLLWGALSRTEAQDMLDRRIAHAGAGIDGETGSIVLAAVLKDEGSVVGEFMLRLNSAESRQGEIGWLIHPDHQGRGLATEGARFLLHLAFVDLELHRVIAQCDPRNGASIRVMERIGMRREAEFRENLFLKGEWAGELVYAILRSEWESGGA